MFDWLRAKTGILATPANVIAAKLRDARGDRAQLDALRRDAMVGDCWSELSLRFPDLFRESFELVGGGTPVAAPARPSTAPAEIPAFHLYGERGHDVFLRIVRASGAIETIAGHVSSVTEDGRKLDFDSYQPEALQLLAQPGDSQFFPDLTSRSGRLTLGDGDRLVALTRLPVAFPAVASAPAQRRASMRERAEAVEAGTYTPRVDLGNADRYLVRDASGKPRTDTAGRPIFRDEFVTAVKIEQNVFAMPLVHRIGRRMIELLATDEVVQAAAGLPLDSLRTTLWARVAEPAVGDVMRELAADTGSPLSRAFANMDTLCRFSAVFLPGVLDEAQRGDARNLLQGGASTAFLFLCALAQCGEHFAKQRPELNATSVVRDSLPLTLRVASSSLRVFAYVAGQLFSSSKPFDAERSFVVVEHKGALRLELNPASMEEIAKAHGLRLENLLAGTTGCPAAQSLFGANLMKDFTDAFVTMLEKRQALISSRAE